GPERAMWRPGGPLVGVAPRRYVGPVTPRVLHVAQTTGYGMVTFLGYVVRDQVARGWDVSLACPSEGQLAEVVHASGAKRLVWEAVRQPSGVTVGETARLRRLVDQVDPDLVHLHCSKAGLAGRLAVRGRRPTVFQPNAWSWLAVHGATRAASVRWERLAMRW